MMCMPISKQRVLELHARLKKKIVCQDGLNMQTKENKHNFGFSLESKSFGLSAKSKYLFVFSTIQELIPS